MTRRPKRSRLHIKNHITRSKALACLVHNDINQRTIPMAAVQDPKPPDEEHEDSGEMPFDHDSQSYASAYGTAASTSYDSESESSLEGRSTGDDLPAPDSFPPEQQLHVLFGGVDEQLRQDEPEQDAGLTDDREEMDVEEDGDDMIPMDAQEQAMLDLLLLCQDEGTSLKFFDTLVTLLRRHGKKGFDIRKASRRQTFLDNLRKKISCPRPIIAQVGPHQVPKFNLLEQIIDLLKSVIFDDVGNLCVNLSPYLEGYRVG
jgi:hypothetical protein